MTHISSIGAGMFSDLSIAVPATELTPAAAAALNSKATFDALFATEVASVGGTPAADTFVRMPEIREFPQMGVPANIVNVPRYGSAATTQVQGQADNPTLEFTCNYIAAQVEAGTLIGDRIGDGRLRAFRFAMLNSKPDAYTAATAGLGTVENTYFYFLGKLEAIVYNPQLTDANQAMITLSQQSELFGGFTFDPV